MFQAMLESQDRYDADYIVGYFETEDLFIEALKTRAEIYRNFYAGKTQSGFRTHYLIRNGEGSRHNFTNRYYLIKLSNGWTV